MPDPAPTLVADHRPPQRISRSRLLTGAVGALAALGAGGVAAAGLARGGATPLTARDLTVLGFALGIEQLQADFYAQALAAGHLTGEARQFAEIVGREERAHVRYVRDALGGRGTASRERARSAGADQARFVAAAVQLEEIGLAAYNGQAENLSRSALASVSRIISVEARHAAWARSLAGELPAPTPIDVPIAASVAMTRLRPFVAA